MNAYEVTIDGVTISFLADDRDTLMTWVRKSLKNVPEETVLAGMKSNEIQVKLVNGTEASTDFDYYDYMA